MVSASFLELPQPTKPEDTAWHASPRKVNSTLPFPMLPEGKIQIESGSTLYKFQNPGIIEVSIILAMMGTAHAHAARSEPETGASPEAGPWGILPEHADRTRPRGRQ